MKIVSNNIEFSVANITIGEDDYPADVYDDGTIDIDVEDYGNIYFTADELQEVASFVKSFRDRRITYKAKNATA